MRRADEPGRIASGALAVLVHLMFFGLLVFGLSWQKKIASPIVVDLWQELPEPVKKAVPPPEPVKKAVPPPEPKPVPKVIPTPVPPKPVPEVKKEPVAPPPPPKVETPKPSAADIELKEKLRKQKEEEEAERREEQKRAEADRKEELKKAEAEQKRIEAEEKRAEQEKVRKEEEARKAEERKQAEEQKRVEEAKREEERKQKVAAEERDRQKQEAARKVREAEEAKAAARAAQQKLINDWRARIQAAVKSRVVLPPNIEGNPEARFEVVLLPGGDVLSATLKKSSGNAAYDDAVERAINRASPLPVPNDTDLFQENFRELNLVFRPKDKD